MGVCDKVLYFCVDGESGARIGGKALKSPQQFANKKFILLKSVFEEEIKSARQGASCLCVCVSRVSHSIHDRSFSSCLSVLPPLLMPRPTFPADAKVLAAKLQSAVVDMSESISLKLGSASSPSTDSAITPLLQMALRACVRAPPEGGGMTLPSDLDTVITFLQRICVVEPSTAVEPTVQAPAPAPSAPVVDTRPISLNFAYTSPQLTNQIQINAFMCTPFGSMFAAYRAHFLKAANVFQFRVGGALVNDHDTPQSLRLRQGATISVEQRPLDGHEWQVGDKIDVQDDQSSPRWYESTVLEVHGSPAQSIKVCMHCLHIY